MPTCRGPRQTSDPNKQPPDQMGMNIRMKKPKSCVQKRNQTKSESGECMQRLDRYTPSERPAALRTTAVLLMFQMALWAAPLSSRGADFDIPLKELKTSGTNFEIPLGDLKQGEKKAKKPETRKHKRKKKTEHAEQEPSGGTTTNAAEGSHKPASATGGAPAASMPEAPILQHPTAPEKVPEASGTVVGTTATAADGVAIIHDPYSYVVAGKRTVITAVIISPPEGLQSVYCRFRTTETAGFARVPMTRVEGTQYTYAATLPALSPGTGSLRYMLVAGDTMNKETSSREFSIPVKATSVIPGWQREQSSEKIKVRLESPDKPLEGFSDAIAADGGTS